MRKLDRKLAMLGLMLFSLFLGSALAGSRRPEVVGKVVNSSNATVEGVALLSNGTILSGDAIDVGAGGSVILSFSPSGRASIGGSTEIRFDRAAGDVVADLATGTVAVERESHDGIVVRTPKYRVTPQGQGRTEFLVSLLPDKSAIVAAQKGEVAITEAQSGESYMLAEGLLAKIPSPGSGQVTQSEEQGEVIGKVVASTGATQNTKPLNGGGWIYDGDSISTGANGHAVIQLWPANQVTMNENTAASFNKPVDRVWLHLQSGTVLVENSGESTTLIATPNFHIEPTTAAPSKVIVGIGADNSTSLESRFGDFRVGRIPSGPSYLLPAGTKVLIAAKAKVIPGLQPIAAAAPSSSASTPTSTPLKPPPPQGTHSHTTLIILAIAAGGGIAGAAAALGGGGHGGGSPPVSPSAP